MKTAVLHPVVPASSPTCGLALHSLSFGRNGCKLYGPLSFVVPPRHILAILGPNGCGKTTLLETMNGMLTPVEGQAEAPGGAAFVPQHVPEDLPYSVEDIVLMGRASFVKTLSLPRPSDEAAAAAALAALGLSNLAKRSFRTLSGGQRQLVMIARAAATEAQTMLLDEPTAALDLRNQEKILALLLSLAHDHGMTIAYTTHDPLHALISADYALMLFPDGRFSYGPTEKILSEESIETAYGVKAAFPTDPLTGKRLFVPSFRLG